MRFVAGIISCGYAPNSASTTSCETARTKANRKAGRLSAEPTTLVVPTSSWYGSFRTASKSAAVSERPIASMIPASEGSIKGALYHVYAHGATKSNTTPVSMIAGKAAVALSAKMTSASPTLELRPLEEALLLLVAWVQIRALADYPRL